MNRTIEVGKSTGTSRPDETDKTKPLEPLDPSTVKEKKARLASPTFEPASPETSRRPEDEEAKPQSQSSTAEKPSSQKDTSPILDVITSLIEGGTPVTPQASPTPAAKEPAKEAKTSKPDEKKPEEKVEIPLAEIVKSEKMTKPLDPETRPMKATPPTSEANPAVVDDEPPAKNAEAAKGEAKLPVLGKPSATEEPEKKPTRGKTGILKAIEITTSGSHASLFLSR